MTWVYFTVMVSFTIGANLLLRIGGMAPPETKFVFGFLGWTGLFGLGLFAISGLLYAVILSRLPLNVAQSIAAIQFVGVLLGAYFILGETITNIRIIGMVLILIGIVLVSFQIEDSSDKNPSSVTKTEL